MTVATLTYKGTVTLTSCWCGIPLGLPTELYDYMHRRDQSAYCPLGHTFVYGDNENERLKRDLKAAKDRAAAWQARADQSEASLRATKGHVTRLRKKVIAGECPFCGQHLRDLARHIGRKHPDEPVEVTA
jgi:hypothetical protein